MDSATQYKLDRYTQQRERDGGATAAERYSKACTKVLSRHFGVERPGDTVETIRDQRRVEENWKCERADCPWDGVGWPTGAANRAR